MSGGSATTRTGTTSETTGSGSSGGGSNGGTNNGEKQTLGGCGNFPQLPEARPKEADLCCIMNLLR